MITKNISFLIYKVLYFFDKIFGFITARSFIKYLAEFIRNNSIIKKKIFNKNILFFAPNELIKWRVKTIYSKEPETINWINNFKKNSIFWDIGANIGLYSIYAALKLKKIKIMAFEPSSLNYNILAKNISMNKLNTKINIFQIPLTSYKNKFLNFNETSFSEGSALHSFNTKTSKKKILNSYKIYGTSIDFLIKNKIVDFPDYVKIDVDGIEDKILNSAKSLLKSKKLKSVLIETSISKKKNIIKLLKKNNFIIKDSHLLKDSNEVNLIFAKK